MSVRERRAWFKGLLVLAGVFACSFFSMGAALDIDPVERVMGWIGDALTWAIAVLGTGTPREEVLFALLVTGGLAAFLIDRLALRPAEARKVPAKYLLLITLALLMGPGCKFPPVVIQPTPPPTTTTTTLAPQPPVTTLAPAPSSCAKVVAESPTCTYAEPKYLGYVQSAMAEALDVELGSALRFTEAQQKAATVRAMVILESRGFCTSYDLDGGNSGLASEMGIRDGAGSMEWLQLFASVGYVRWYGMYQTTCTPASDEEQVREVRARWGI